MPKRNGISHVMSPDIASTGLAVLEFLDAWDDEYNGVIIDTNCLPSNANVFAYALRASLSNWKLKVRIILSSDWNLTYFKVLISVSFFSNYEIR